MREGLILQHALTGPPGRLGTWARSRGISFRVHRSWESSPAELDPTHFGWIASLGSAFSANATDPAWVGAEVALLRGAVDTEVPVLGLCWGGQALARALGATVSGAPFAEKDWLAVDSADPAIPAGPWLHYHTEIFSVPTAATELAHSPAGPAAFAVGPHLGLQFHPEADAEIAQVWADKDPDQTQESRDELAAQGRRFSDAAHPLAERLFDGWWAGVLSARGEATAASGPPSR